jgi:glucans biosynthesis protein C
MVTVANSSVSSGRRYDVDWLRLGALALLILYHVLCVFDSRAWLTKSEYAGPWADGFIALLTPWRITLVFLIGGVAVRFLLDKLDTYDFVRDRVQRLIVPFVFAVVVLAPPQAYVSLVERGLEHNSFWDFWMHRAWSVVHYHGLAMPSLEHAWFLPYLFGYSVVTAFLWRYRAKVFAAARRAIEAAPTWAMVAGVMAWFVFVDAVVTPLHARSVLVFTDITGHLRFAPIFVLGFIVARSAPFWSKLHAARHSVWAAAIVLMAASYVAGHIDAPDVAVLAMRALYGGAMLFAFVALGAAVMNKPSPVIAYGADAILPIYLLHQTLVVVIAHFSGANHWPVLAEFTFLMVVALALPLALYHTLIRPSRVLRFLFGVRIRGSAFRAPAVAGGRPA